jgi:hypothetical protein
MTAREKIKAALAALEREARLDTGGGMGNPEGALDAVEKAVDEAIAEAVAATRTRSVASWERVEDKISAFRDVVTARVTGQGACMADLSRARTAILDAVRALPDRRERIAVAAMQGLLASDHDWDHPAREIATVAVDQADALIAKLDGSP